MAKLKKYQLLEKAMRDYPAGTKYTWSGNKVFTSTGVFSFCGDSIIRDNSTDHHACVYNSLTWAIIFPQDNPSILSGKCAIQVNNEREFKLLMEHYESKGWRSVCGTKPEDIDYDVFCRKSVRYENGFATANTTSFHEKMGYKIIPFADFAKEVGIEVPVFVMTSEDGVDLYRGDEYFRACLIEGEWRLTSGVGRFTLNDPIRMPAFKSAWFSTREAAEAFVKEANKPLHVEVKLFNKNQSAIITDDKVVIKAGVATILIRPSDLEDMLHAYKSLQP